MNLQVLMMAVVTKTGISRKIPNYFKFVKKMNLNITHDMNPKGVKIAKTKPV